MKDHPTPAPSGNVRSIAGASTGFAELALVVLSIATVAVPSVVRWIPGLLLIYTLLQETHLILFARYFDLKHPDKGLMLALPTLGALTVMGFVLFQYLTGQTIYASVVGLSFTVAIGAYLTKRIRRAAPDAPPLASKENLVSVFAAVGSVAAAFYFAVYYYFTYWDSPTVFLFGDQATYLGDFRGYTLHGVDLANSGVTLYGHPLGSFLVSSLTTDSWLFYIFNGAANPTLFYACLTGVFAALFLLAAFTFALGTLPIRTRVLSLSFVVAGFSFEGLIWVWLKFAKVSGNSIAPPFFAGTPFPYGTGLIYLEGVSGDVLYKAAFHGMAYISFLAFLYVYATFDRKRAWPLHLLLVGVTWLAYVPIGAVLLWVYILTELSYLVKIRRPALLIGLAALPFLVIAGIGVTFTVPLVGFYMVPKNVSQITASIISLFLFTGVFLFLLADRSARSRLSARIIGDPGMRATLILTTMCVASLLFFTTYTSTGIGEDYLWGILLTLGLIWYLPAVLDRGTPSGPTVSEAGATDQRPVPSRTAVDTGNRLNRSAETSLILMVVVVVSLPTVVYMVQSPSLFPSSPNVWNNQTIYVTPSEEAMASWISTNLPATSTILVPPQLWFLAGLSGHQLLVGGYGTTQSQSKLNFSEMFFTPGLHTTFNSNTSLIGWTNLSQKLREGAARITTNESLNGSAVLEVMRQNYTNIYHNTSIPLASLQLVFAVYPTILTEQPYDTMGVGLLLSNGEQIVFQQNTNTSRPGEFAFPLSLTVDAWNFVSINLSRLLSPSQLAALTNTQVDQIILEGGVNRVIYWGYVGVGPASMTLSEINNSFTKWGVTNVVVNTSLPNSYTNLLASARVLSLQRTFGPWQLYLVAGP